ncbi:MAG: nucleotidyltransferase family protein [Cyanobacteria bacterium J06648_16]
MGMSQTLFSELLQKAEQLTHDEKLRLIRHVDWLLHRPEPKNRIGHRLADLLAYQHEIVELAHKHGASNVRLFGSFARDQAGPDSDVDLLVDFEKKISYSALIGLIQDIETLIGRRADVVTFDGLTEAAKTTASKESIPLCAPMPTAL